MFDAETIAATAFTRARHLRARRLARLYKVPFWMAIAALRRRGV